jgi:hypothetical protein
MVTDREGRVVLAGQVPLAQDASFHMDVSGKLLPGRFTLLAQMIVNGNAAKAEIKRVPIDITTNP